MKPEGKQAEFIKLITDGAKYVLVEAPAGTGKTYCCIQATKALCENGCLLPFQKVLILTFSRNARAQLLKELSYFPSHDNIYKHVNVNNYHSFFKKYLDAYRDTIGIEQPLSVVDDDTFYEGLLDYATANSIIINPHINCETLDDYCIKSGKLIKLNAKSKLKKAQLKDAELFIKTAYGYTNSTGVICFAQFGCLIYKIINRLPEMAQAISHDYPVVILDEYQDTNYYQEAFVEAVLKKSRGIFFGDRYQMIYDFRGSTLERLNNLSALYPDLQKFEFDEYFRYKDKSDLVKILTDIRNDQIIDYSGLKSGGVISFSIDCNPQWRNIKKESSKRAQCTVFCKNTYFKIIKLVLALLRQHKSIAILCRENIEADKLANVFLDYRMHPKTVSDTKEMVLIGKHLKKCLCDYLAVNDIVSDILSICLLCTSSKHLGGETYDTISHMDFSTLKRKKKDEFAEIKKIIVSSQYASELHEKWNVIYSIIKQIISNGDVLNYSRTTFVSQCLKLVDATPDSIDKIMLQRQYTNSFTNISPGLYITTIHQSKGKEFDCVFVLDVDNIKSDRNVLYVSHSRMKESLYPVIVKYNGRNFER